MAKRTFATTALFTFVLLTAPAQSAHADDGCELLKELVRSSVHASATEFAADQRAGQVRALGRAGAVGSTLTGTQTCINTAAAATKAFSEALAALNMPVTWNRGPMDPGDYCLSGDLRQCYPSQYPLSASLQPHQAAFVYDAWKGVRTAVAAQMPFGTASGVSQFTPGSLQAVLSSSLNSSVDGPLYSHYQGFEGARSRR
jgi:hypothetical protein